MIEINAVREKYASMHDSELLSFAKEEGHQLTTEGFSLLKEAFINRRLDMKIIENIETGKIPGSDEYLMNTEEYNHAVVSLHYLFDQKEYGRTNEEIISGIIEMGLDESQAIALTGKIETIAKHRLKKAELEKLTGGLIFTCGLAITFLPLSITANRLAYIIAWCCILFGMLRYFKGLYNKDRFKKILENIAIENNP